MIANSKNLRMLTSAGLIAVGCVYSVSASDIITPGFTFSVASSSSDNSTGTHYHSNTGGAFGNPAGKAEVGDYRTEEVRGLSEWNLAGLSSGNAYVNFTVYKKGGLFLGQNDFPFNGLIDVFAYNGNNLEDISDYQAPTIGQVGSFNTTGLNVGDAVSFDISTIYNAALTAGDISLGIRLQTAPGVDAAGGAYTFENVTLTTTPSGTVIVPTPDGTTTILPLLISVLSCGVFGRWVRKA